MSQKQEFVDQVLNRLEAELEAMETKHRAEYRKKCEAMPVEIIPVWRNRLKPEAKGKGSVTSNDMEPYLERVIERKPQAPIILTQEVSRIQELKRQIRDIKKGLQVEQAIQQAEK